MSRVEEADENAAVGAHLWEPVTNPACTRKVHNPQRYPDEILNRVMRREENRQVLMQYFAKTVASTAVNKSLRILDLYLVEKFEHQVLVTLVNNLREDSLFDEQQ